jgi:hypothetical protein
MEKNSIGEFEFFSLSGMPEAEKTGISISARAGVDGISAWKTGRRGRGGTVRSVVDCLDLAAAGRLFLAYCQLIAADPQEVYWADISLSSHDVKYLVVDVRLVQNKRIYNSVGGTLDGEAEAILICDWDLLPVAIA